ncbi:hypothetical protein QBC43DRAFT_289317 [Cladorrhinum sp. PSN259]|nr:hypothetical protein QBC43DRAFT_289317 [Cladorrhinum sp. PSN259]
MRSLRPWPWISPFLEPPRPHKEDAKWRCRHFRRGCKRTTKGQDKPSGQKKTSSRKSAKAVLVEQWRNHHAALQMLLAGYGGQQKIAN